MLSEPPVSELIFVGSTPVIDRDPGVSVGSPVGVLVAVGTAVRVGVGVPVGVLVLVAVAVGSVVGCNRAASEPGVCVGAAHDIPIERSSAGAVSMPAKRRQPAITNLEMPRLLMGAFLWWIVIRGRAIGNLAVMQTDVPAGSGDHIGIMGDKHDRSTSGIELGQ